MKRVVAALLLTTFVAAGVVAPAHAGKKSKRVTRTETVPYSLPALGSADATGVCPPTDCIRVTPGPNEKWLSVKIADASGYTPAATIGQDQTEGDQFVDRVADICGQTHAPVPILPGVEIVIWVWAAPSFVTVPCEGAGSSGEVTLTFSNKL
ncbi:MAG: hypothetical protein ABR505_03010 [Actinomycetota bacterium]